MRLNKFRIKNFKSIKDSGDIYLDNNLFVLAGQNESGKSSILEALSAFELQQSQKEDLNFELENNFNNLTQEIACTYNKFDEGFILILAEEVLKEAKTKSESLKGKKIKDVFDVEKLHLIREFSLTIKFDFLNDSESKLELDLNSLNIFNTSLKSYSINYNNKTLKKNYISNTDILNKIPQIFKNFTPQIVFFRDFSAILPDSFKINQINNVEIQGQKAVKSFESILNINFEDIVKKNTLQKNSTIEFESNILSVDFQKDWKQRIYENNQVNIKFRIENDSVDNKEVFFFIETKDNEFLPPRKRSKGMIWFLSLWLDLKAATKDKKLIILFDEPGQFLHLRANKDMLAVFNRFASENHQIIYSTHSPSLIDTNNFHNIGLVYNDKINGTMVESVTSSKFDSVNKQDALQPIAAAMGYAPSADFNVLSNKNVILEGLSDFYYFNAMAKLLEIKFDYKFIPALGIKAPKVLPLISFCIGYGLEWRLVMDNGENPQNTRTEIKDHIFGGEETITDKYIIIADAKEVEDLFSLEDMKLVNPKLNISKATLPSDVIKNNKIIVSKSFSNLVDNNKINKDNLSQKAIDNFTNLFDRIKESFSNLD